ncbi:unnamed protein product [Closterium sp. NIES-53]
MEETRGAEPGGAETGGAGSGGAEIGGAEPVGDETGGAEPGGAESGGAEPLGAEPGGTEPGGAEPGGTEPGGAESARVASRGASSRREVLSPRELREWFARRWGRAAGAGGTTAAPGPGGTAEAARVGPTGGSAGASGGAGAAGSAGTGATGVGATGGVGAGGSADAGTSEGAGAGAPGAGGATSAGAPTGSPGTVLAGSGGAPRPRPYFVPLLEQVLGLPPSPGPAPPLECPQPVQSQSQLPPVSPLPAPSPYTCPTGGLAERHAPASRPASPARPACTSRRTSRPRPPAVPGTHQMALRPSTAPLRVPLPSPPASSLPASADPESDSLRAASPTVARFLATVVTDPSLASTAAVDLDSCLLLAHLAVLYLGLGSDFHIGALLATHRTSSRVLRSRTGMGLVLGGRRPVVLTGHADASWADDQATQRSSRGYTFSLGSGSISWRSTRSSSVLSSSCEAEIYAGAMAAQELRWLTYLLTDLGEQPRSPPILYVDNKAMLALCREHRLEHRTKHIALRYFLARELQQRGQLRLAYVASEANTADIFTKLALLCLTGLVTSCSPPLCLWGSRAALAAPRATRGGPLATPAALLAAPCGPTTASCCCLPSALRCPASPRSACCTAMASLRVLAFHHEGRLIQFDTWLKDLQLYLLSDSRDSVSLFDHMSGAAPAPPTTADNATRSQWLTRDAAARLAIRNHLPLAECAHFGEHKTAQALYDAVVTRYSSPATAALGRLRLPYLFPELSASATVKDLVSNLRASDARYCAAAPAEDHFLFLNPTVLTVDLLEQHLLAVETSVVAVGAARGTPRTPFFEGCSPSPLAPSYASAAAVDVPSAEDVGAASNSAKRRSSKGKVEAVEVVAVVGVVAGVGALVVAVEAAVGVAVVAAVGVVAVGLELSVEILEEAKGSCSSVGARPRPPSSFAAALGASEFSLLGTAPAEALYTFTLDSGASRFVARCTVLPCPAVPSGSLSGLHLPSFSTNLVSTSALQDSMVTTTTPGGQVAPPYSCRLLSHKTLLWHHRLGHPSLPCLRGMHSRLLVSGLPRSLPPLPPSPAPPCLPCVEGRQRAAPHSSSFLPRTAPLQTLHMDVWGPACVSGRGCDCYFLLVVDDYMRYTTVFPLHSKGEVHDVLITWIHAVCLQLREWFRQDLPLLPLHSDRGGEFSSDFLRDFCRWEGILQSFMLPASPQQNGIAECRIGLVMEVARTSMIHAAAPHFLWPFAVRYAAHQLNLWPRVSLLETSPTLRWTGEVGDASVFRVRGSRAFVFNTSADKLSAHAIPCVFLGFPSEAPGWQFYHPTSCRIFPSQDVTFDELVPFYRLFPYRSAPTGMRSSMHTRT